MIPFIITSDRWYLMMELELEPFCIHWNLWYIKAYQGVRNNRFSENLVCFVFLKHPFWDSPFNLITNDFVYSVTSHKFVLGKSFKTMMKFIIHDVNRALSWRKLSIGSTISLNCRHWDAASQEKWWQHLTVFYHYISLVKIM